ncbi:MAG: SAM-dependent methyltransferase, partial [Gammaproteobacteria bacterium]
ANPQRHIDIGSRIDGFVAHVASYRKIEVFDIRALDESRHSNIKFVQKDLMDHNDDSITDSISCLHAIEHFGLGRYGDPIDPQGHFKGVKNIVRMLKPGGTLYISFPIGFADAVHFNAHRVFHPESIFEWEGIKEQFELQRFDWVDATGEINMNANVKDAVDGVKYGCGIYTFKKHD